MKALSKLKVFTRQETRCIIWDNILRGRIFKESIVGTTRFVYWQDGNMWLGYLEEYPDYMTQGKSLEELKENLKAIYDDLTSGAIPYVRKVAELEIA
jgi:hypothetical protein